MPRLAIINEAWNAGAARCAKDLLRLGAYGYDIRYFPEQDGVKENEKNLRGKLESFKPDILHLHSYYGNLPYRFLSEISQIYPAVFTPHDPRPIGAAELECWECPHNRLCICCPLIESPFKKGSLIGNRYFQSRIKKKFFNHRIHPRTKIISPSAWFLERFQKQEFKRFELRHIPNGIDTDHFKPIPDARKICSLPQGVKIILYAASPMGGINSRKGMTYLWKAFVNYVLSEIPDAYLMIAGENFVPNHRHVIPLGEISHENLPLYYSSADVFVCPTLADNLPFVILEAMGCETPVIASRVGGIPEIVQEGVTGYLTPPKQVEYLAEKIIQMLANENQAKAMGCQGRLAVEKSFGIQKFIQAHDKLYREILERAG